MLSAERGNRQRRGIGVSFRPRRGSTPHNQGLSIISPKGNPSEEPFDAVAAVKAAREERDHLAWCETRLSELGGSASRLNPVFYAGSFALGVASGLLGDKWSMGFLVETERQVEAHLSDHLGRLPETDSRSRKILEVMREDEIHHGQTGKAHGAAELPAPVRAAMKLVSNFMTRSAYWI